jgi:acylphosphatase
VKKAAVIKVYGRVQGVGFRYYTQKKANELGITGYVKNRPDGSVYIEAEGEQENLELFIDWCEVGPSWAHVTKLEKQYVPLFGEDDFKIK